MSNCLAGMAASARACSGRFVDAELGECRRAFRRGSPYPASLGRPWPCMPLAMSPALARATTTLPTALGAASDFIATVFGLGAPAAYGRPVCWHPEPSGDRHAQRAGKRPWRRSAHPQRGGAPPHLTGILEGPGDCWSTCHRYLQMRWPASSSITAPMSASPSVIVKPCSLASIQSMTCCRVHFDVAVPRRRDPAARIVEEPCRWMQAGTAAMAAALFAALTRGRCDALDRAQVRIPDCACLQSTLPPDLAVDRTDNGLAVVRSGRRPFSCLCTRIVLATPRATTIFGLARTSLMLPRRQFTGCPATSPIPRPATSSLPPVRRARGRRPSASSGAATTIRRPGSLLLRMLRLGP